VLELFPETKSGGGNKSRKGTTEGGICYGVYGAPSPDIREVDSGSAARFFYSAKASKNDRAGSKHPTVKPVSLMRWLCRMITPPGGTVLDPFAGSGTTGEAAILEGFRAILIEREDEYVADIRRRLRWVPPDPVGHADSARLGCFL
jgi:site-specific DNA-methyltransferase (adenine-specific)